MSDKIVNIFVHLPNLTNDDYVEDIAEKAARVRDAGMELCLHFNWHVLVPYHGPPPHLNAKTEAAKLRAGGLGYAPFGWRKGWKWAVEEMNAMMAAFQPEYILYGQDPHIRDDWDWATKPEYHYNDKLGMLKQAIYGVDAEEWVVDPLRFKPRFILIPSTPGSKIQGRGIQKVRKEFAGIDPLPQNAVQFTPLPSNGDVDPEPEPEYGACIRITLGSGGWCATAYRDVDNWIATESYSDPREALDAVMVDMASLWMAG